MDPVLVDLALADQDSADQVLADSLEDLIPQVREVVLDPEGFHIIANRALASMPTKQTIRKTR